MGYVPKGAEWYLARLVEQITVEGEPDNRDGQSVTIKFRGLRELGVIHDPLDHGTELEYEEHLDMDEAAIKEWISRKGRSRNR